MGCAAIPAEVLLHKVDGHVVRLVSIGAQQAGIRTVIAPALADHVNESGRSVDALVAMRQAEAIVKALETAGYEIKPRT